MINSSIFKKYIMALTGFFLITFLLVHLLINSFSLFSKDLFNTGSHFMATNPIIYIMQYILAAGFLVHIIYGIILTIQNKKARGDISYQYKKLSNNSSFTSRNMIYTGVIVLLFLILHMKDFFIEIKFNHLSGLPSDYDLLVTVFSSPLYVSIYVISFVFLSLHLHHGFQSSFQSMGVNQKKITPIIKQLSTIYCVIIGLGFSTIAIFHFING